MVSTSGLARYPVLTVGALEVCPSTCDVVANGERHPIEPRAMQVLVQLAQAQGSTVTRYDLVQESWDGRNVSDDAINRIIARLRNVAEDYAGGSFKILTVRKVGYRLLAPPEAAEVATHPRPSRLNYRLANQRKTPRRLTAWLHANASRGVVAIAALVTVLIGAFASVSHSNSQARPEDRPQGYQQVANELTARGAAAVFEQTPEQLQQAIGYFRQAIARTPEDPTLWGSLAIAYGLSARSVPPDQQGYFVQRSLQASARGLAIDPGDGHALAAPLIATSGFGDWLTRDANVRAAVKKSNGHSPAPLYQFAKFEAAVGRNRIAQEANNKAYAKHPLVPWINGLRIQLLAASGRQDEAEEAAASAASLWPRDPELWYNRYCALLFGGVPSQALRMAQQKSDWYRQARSEDLGLFERVAASFSQPHDPERTAVLDALEARAHDGQGYAEQAMLIAAFAGDKERAIRLATQLLGPNSSAIRWRFVDHDEFALAGERPTAALFLSPMHAIWGDARFAELLRRNGFIDYWRKSGPPDLCELSDAPAFCIAARTPIGSRSK